MKSRDDSLDETVNKIFKRAGIWCGTCRRARLERLRESDILEETLIGDLSPGTSHWNKPIPEEATSEGHDHPSPDTNQPSDGEKH